MSNLKSFQDHDEDQANLCLMKKSHENNEEESVIEAVPESNKH